MSRFPSLLRLLAAGLAAAGLFVLASSAFGRDAAVNPRINVNYSLSGAITMSLADGTPIGSTSGSPTVIPAGWYDFEMLGPGGCASIPQYILKGPGIYLSDNLDGGETQFLEHPAVHLQPSSTYTWTNDANPSVVHTFQTSAIVVGSPPDAASKDGLSSSKHTTVSSSDIVGSNLYLPRGTITGAVSSGGKLTFAVNGKVVTTLKKGAYTFKVIDQSKNGGFLLRKVKGKRVTTVSGAKFVGRKTMGGVKLSIGNWYFMTGSSGKPVLVRVVSPT